MYTHIYTMKVPMMWADTSETGGDYVDEVVDGEGIEGLPACRGTDGIAAGDAGRAGKVSVRRSVTPPSMNVTREWSIFAWSGTVARLSMTTTS